MTANAALVAVEADGGVVGWIHVYLCPSVIADLEAEIGGLVVDEAHRSQGIGAQWVQVAED